MIAVAFGELSQLVRELEQQLQPVAHLEPEEVLADLGELRGQGHPECYFAGTECYFAGTAPGSPPVTIGTFTAEPHSVQEPS